MKKSPVLFTSENSDETNGVNSPISGRERYSGAIKKIISGKPDEKFISSSYIERQNLTMRYMRRFTRQTSGFSKNTRIIVLLWRCINDAVQKII